MDKVRRITLLQKRLFSFSSRHYQQDLVQNLYLQEIRQYKPAKSSAKVDLPETFTFPTPPPVPVIEVQTSSTSAAGKAEVTASDEFAPLVDPIENSEHYCGL